MKPYSVMMDEAMIQKLKQKALDQKTKVYKLVHNALVEYFNK